MNNFKATLSEEMSGITEEILEEQGITSLAIIQEVDVKSKKSITKPRLIVKTCGTDPLNIDGEENIIEFIKNIKDIC